MDSNGLSLGEVEVASLYDTIKQGLQQVTAQPAPMTDQTVQASRLLRAKSGKAVSGPEVSRVPVGEQAAVQQTQLGLEQLRPQAALQAQQVGTAEQAQQEAAGREERQIAQSRRIDTVQNRIQTERLLNDLARDKQSLNLDKDRARLEQAGAYLALQDQQYVDRLQDEGRRARLDDKATFKEELQKSIFGDNTDLLQTQLGNRSILDANDREFRRALKNIDLATAAALVRNEIATSNEQAKWEGIGNIIGAGVQGVGAYANMPKASGTQSLTTTPIAEGIDANRTLNNTGALA